MGDLSGHDKPFPTWYPYVFFAVMGVPLLAYGMMKIL
jgi:hypothetical protein